MKLNKNRNADHRDRQRTITTVLTVATYVAITAFLIIVVGTCSYLSGWFSEPAKNIWEPVVEKVEESSSKEKSKEEKTVTEQEQPVTSEPPADLTIEQRIQTACAAYNIPYDITLAIARLETGWFTSDAYIYGNNPGGLSVNETPIYFDTIEDGVYAFIDNLAHNYFAMGLDTPEKIGEKYCPVDPNWAQKIHSVMLYKS